MSEQTLEQRANAIPVSGTLVVGKYQLSRNYRGSLWIENGDGEGMELNDATERKFQKLVDKFFKEHF